MGDIGKEERFIEVLPAEDPWPRPEKVPTPVEAPEREPSENPA